MRIRNALCSLLLAVPLIVSGSVASAAAEPTVALKTTTPWVLKYRTAVLKGRVKGLHRPLVTIQQRNVGKRKWKFEARKRASKAGYFTHREDVRSGARDYRACVKDRCTKPVRVNMGKQPTGLSRTSPSHLSVEVGQEFTISGTAIALNGKTINIVARDNLDSEWYRIGRTVVHDGVWSATVSLTTPGEEIRVRARFPGSKTLRLSTSSAVKVEVNASPSSTTDHSTRHN